MIVLHHLLIGLILAKQLFDLPRKNNILLLQKVVSLGLELLSEFVIFLLDVGNPLAEAQPLVPFGLYGPEHPGEFSDLPILLPQHPTALFALPLPLFQLPPQLLIGLGGQFNLQPRPVYFLLPAAGYLTQTADFCLDSVHCCGVLQLFDLQPQPTVLEAQLGDLGIVGVVGWREGLRGGVGECRRLCRHDHAPGRRVRVWRLYWVRAEPPPPVLAHHTTNFYL